VLDDDGVYVMNVIDGGENRFAEWQLATLRDQFDHLAVIVPPGGNDDRVRNQILVASNAPLPAIDVASSDGEVIAADAVDEFIGDGRVLRDDFAPVERLTADFG